MFPGKILTIETVPLKLPRRRWEGPEVDPDQTYFSDEYLRHVLYITRIYFIYGAPEEELIGNSSPGNSRLYFLNQQIPERESILFISMTSGAQDFLPDFLRAPRWYSIYGIYPKYKKLDTAMTKAKDWIQSARVSIWVEGYQGSSVPNILYCFPISQAIAFLKTCFVTSGDKNDSIKLIVEVHKDVIN